MEKIELKCSNCGGALNKVETQKDMYVCLHCGNKEIIKEEKNTTNYYINQNITKNIYGKENNSNSDYFKLIENAEKFIKLEDYKMALKLLNQAKEVDPGHYLVWWLLVKSKILSNIKNKKENSFAIYYSLKNIENDYERVVSFVSDVERKEVEEEYKNLYKEYSQYCESANDYVEANLNKEKPIDFTVFIGLLIFSIMSIIIGLSVPFIIDEPGCFAFLVVGLFLFVISILSGSITKDNKKIIEFIKQKQEISFDELMSFCKEKTENINNKEDLKNRVASLIREGYLVNYKIEKDFIIKV